jgi:hypothetical protein
MAELNTGDGGGGKGGKSKVKQNSKVDLTAMVVCLLIDYVLYAYYYLSKLNQ